jgi:ubiquinone/menaquinone biosynthesis C-methylase UbiE
MKYTQNHQTAEAASAYTKTYSSGYYKFQWELLESDLLARTVTNLLDKFECPISALDFACGTGRISAFLNEKFNLDVIGLDVSNEMLKLARRAHPRVKFLNSNLEDFCGRKFDLFFAFRFFLNAEPELRSKVLTNAHNIISEKGRIVFNIHINRKSLLGLAYRWRNCLLGRSVANTASVDEISTLLTLHGFHIDTIIYYSYLPRIGTVTDLVPKFCFLFLDALFKRLNFQPQCFLIVASKVK